MAKCDREKVVTGTKGTLWLGDDTKGSLLTYAPLEYCKWTLKPALPVKAGSTYSSSNRGEESQLDISLTFDRLDLGGGDTIQVFDGANELVAELFAGERTQKRLPWQLYTSTGMFVVEFASDSHSQGTGFLATYDTHPKGFWDVYIVVAISTLSMLVMVCCFCCWMRCKPEEFEEGRAITNNMGMNLQSTERGASLANIQKFPKFYYTPAHLRVMEDIGQSETCTICLGDYEDDEQLRLLPCGHCFHAECVDAWLQINRICPMCKVDVYDLYLQQEKKNILEKKNKKKRKKQAKAKVKAQKKAQKKAATQRKKRKTRGGSGANVMPLSAGDCDMGAIPDASKFGHVRPGTMATTMATMSHENEMYDNEPMLSPIEQFRMRSRRLLDVGGAIDETHLTVGASKTTMEHELLPEIEMAIFPPSRNTYRDIEREIEREIEIERERDIEIERTFNAIESEIEIEGSSANNRSNSGSSQEFQRVPQFMMPPPRPARRRTQNNDPPPHTAQSIRPRPTRLPPLGGRMAGAPQQRNSNGGVPSRPLRPASPSLGNMSRPAVGVSPLTRLAPVAHPSRRRRRSTIAEDDTLLRERF